MLTLFSCRFCLCNNQHSGSASSLETVSRAQSSWMENEEKVQQELLAEMSNIMKLSKATLPKSMCHAVMRMAEVARHNQTAAERLLDFVNIKVEEKLLKITSTDIPEGILPNGFEGVIRDIKLSGYNADDKIYSNDPDIRQKIPRGTTVLEVKNNSRNQTTEDVVIYANRKFTGDFGDEDDCQEQESNDQWKKYFLTDQEETQHVVCIKKINGEAAHFSARMIDDQVYIITGSKNVHMIIKEEKDIYKYVGNRFSIAKVVAKSVWDTLQNLQNNNFRFLIKLLCLTKCTVICELLQPENQHIVNLSNLEKPLLNIIAFSPPAGNEDVSSLIALPPHHTLDLLSNLGLTVPSHTVIEAQDVRGYRDEIRQGKHGYYEEGEVLYFLNKDEETIGLVKTKTVWYIMLRALREKVSYAFQTSRRRQKHQNCEECINSSHKRFSELQEWLLFSHSYLEEWKNLATRFIIWVEEEIREERLKSEDIRPRYPVIWERFLKMSNQTDRIELQYQNSDGTKT